METLEEGQPAHERKVLLEPDRMRVETGRGSMIYRDDRKVLWLVNDNERRYSEMTPQTMAALRQGMEQRMQQMQEQLKNLPEAQRRQLEQMMNQRGMPGAAASRNVTYAKRATGQTVGRWRCDVYEQQVDGRKTAELCLAALGDLGLRSDDVKVLSSFYNESGFQQMSGGRSDEFNFKRLSEVAGREVMPVHVITFNDGQKVADTVVKSVERGAIPPGSFEVPAGYAKRDMPMMPGGKG
jgi:hypothetical protein